MLTLNPFPLPPTKGKLKYCPSVNPLPPLWITTSSTKPPCVWEDSTVNGDFPLLNSKTVPAGSVAVINLSRVMVVSPDSVRTPSIFVSAWIPVICSISWPLRKFELELKINCEAPLFACNFNWAKYLVSGQLSWI